MFSVNLQTSLKTFPWEMNLIKLIFQNQFLHYFDVNSYLIKRVIIY